MLMWTYENILETSNPYSPPLPLFLPHYCGPPVRARGSRDSSNWSPHGIENYYIVYIPAATLMAKLWPYFLTLYCIGWSVQYRVSRGGQMVRPGRKNATDSTSLPQSISRLTPWKPYQKLVPNLLDKFKYVTHWERDNMRWILVTLRPNWTYNCKFR